ncbi:MAG: helix-turn-helix domain-containing protein, partial [Anaerolineae bacterium]|nr:helix-turn-helix domain-containing protein [Anaerolineae bacterium]
LLQTYRETGSISQTACLWHTSHQVVRKWVRRAAEGGEEALQDRSRRPHTSPRQTPKKVEELVAKARQETGYGRRRLAWYLQARYGLTLSPYTIRHILRRRGLVQAQQKQAQPLYPASWAWEGGALFSLFQVDLKEVLDKKALGTLLWDHMRKHRLPPYQGTACEARSRLRFLAYSYRKTLTNGLTFLPLVLMWLRLHGVETPVVFQTDWGQEFGGDTPRHIQALEQRLLAPLGGALRRYPKGRKQVQRPGGTQPPHR